VIIQNNESEAPNPKAVTEPSKTTDLHGPWYDIEDGVWVDDDFHPILPPEQESQPYSDHHPPGSSQVQANQYGNDGTKGGTLGEAATHS